MSRLATDIGTLALAAGMAPIAAVVAAVQGDWMLPPRSGSPAYGAINVVRDAGVDNTGQTDMTVKLDSILTAANSRRMIYFPRGTYLVSGSIQGPGTQNGTATINVGTQGPVIVGESREGTVFRLADGTWPVDNVNITSSPAWGTYADRVVLHGGDCGNVAFSKEMHNFTVNIGSNNAGAIGVNFSTANFGGISDVNVISEDGQGCIGVSLNGGEIGPAYAHSIYVKGFKTGIYASAYDDISIFQVRLEGQTQFGLFNAWTCDIDSISMTTTAANVPGVYNGGNGRLAVLNAFFTGNSTAAGLVNEGGHLFARNIHGTGYARAISSSGTPVAAPAGADPDEYASHGSAGMWYTPGRSMNLPIKYPPFPAREQDTAKWSDVMRYKGGGFGTPSRSDSAALHMALTAPGKTSVEINYGKTWEIPDTVYIEGPIERVIGTKGSISCPAIVIRNNTPPVVVLELLDVGAIVNRSSSTVILQSINGHTVLCNGTGDMFINGFGAGRIVVRSPLQKVWVRDFNGEQGWRPAITSNTNLAALDSANISVSAGQAWLMGYKSENTGVKAYCTGGFLEMFGMIQYGGCVDQDVALFYVEGDAQFSLGLLTQISHRYPNSTRLVSETRNSQERILTNTGSPDGYNLTLYTGYDSTFVRQHLGTVNAEPIRRGQPGVSMSARVLGGKRLELDFALPQASAVSVRLIDMRGRVRTLSTPISVFAAGVHRCGFDLHDIAAGAYCLEVGAPGETRSWRVTLTRGSVRERAGEPNRSTTQ